MTFKEILEYNFISIGGFQLNLTHIIAVLIILTVTRLVVKLITRLIERYFKLRAIDSGRQYAFIQFIKYIVYVGGILMALEAVGITISVLWGGAAALLVGVGLGLQQTFNDLVSGIILLVEGSVDVGDVIEVNGLVGSVTSIGIRTSKIETRDKISLLIPNSKLVGDAATNWSHNRAPTRFALKVGVAYSSDVERVTALLLQAAQDHREVLDTPAPAVQFNDFGNSSLDFTLLFYSYSYMRIEFVKSDLRYRIMSLFRANNIEIPFPQQDIWLRNQVQLDQPLIAPNLNGTK